jgi:peptidoglycan/xylan/chitin deacetylase (PgdA/CDA1 family)
MFAKTMARDLYYWSADLSGRLKARENSMAGALTVLTYHRVLPGDEARACPFPSLAMPLEWFRAQMAWLQRNARVLPLGRALDDTTKADAPLMAVTFDDGYFDNFEYAAPVLKEFGLAGTFFICTAPVRTGSHFWYDSIAEGTLRWGPEELKRTVSKTLEGSDARSIVAGMKKLPDGERREAVAAVERRLGDESRRYRSHVMTRENLQALARSGHEIGSHTETHPILPRMAEPEAAGELRTSKAWLEEVVGKPVPGFCYPNGDHSPATREWVARAGYEYACLTEEGSNAPGFDRLRIRRIDMAPNRVGNCFRRWSERSFRAVLSQIRKPATSEQA